MKIAAAATLAATLVIGAAGAQTPDDPKIRMVPFSVLNDWEDDDHRAALDTFLITCPHIRSTHYLPAEEWDGLCEAGERARDARKFFEQNFVLGFIRDGREPLFTGYYEPQLYGSTERFGVYQYPLYQKPPDLPDDKEPWLSREEIESGALDDQGLELVWLKDPVERYFLHVQGSGRISLMQGGMMRVNYHARNNHTYRSIGKEMIRQGLLAEHEASANRIKSWVRENGQDGAAILNHNPSYVFFESVDDLTPEQGPIGAMGLPLTDMRSVAIDPKLVPLGAPVWIELSSKDDPFRQLMVGQDVGAAVKGAQRADLFIGTGKDAGNQAGKIRYPGRMFVLIPKKRRPSLASAD